MGSRNSNSTRLNSDKSYGSLSAQKRDRYSLRCSLTERLLFPDFSRQMLKVTSGSWEKPREGL